MARQDNYYDRCYGATKRATKVCVDCPSIIPSTAHKVRCSPCSDKHSQDLRQAAHQRRREERLQQRITA